MSQEWGVNVEFPFGLAHLGRHVLMIVGMSGAGKTSIATAIENEYEDARVVPMYTTRAPRPDDVHGHYNYVDSAEFGEAAKQRFFFLWRMRPHPQYGWATSDVGNIVARSHIAIFLFRHGGLRVLLDILPTATVVFLDAPPLEAYTKSNDPVPSRNLAEELAIVDKNMALSELVEQRGWPYLRLKNKYMGIEELKQHAVGIMKFTRSHGSHK